MRKGSFEVGRGGKATLPVEQRAESSLRVEHHADEALSIERRAEAALPVDLRVTRRQLLKAAALAAVSWQAGSWSFPVPAAFAQAAPDDPAILPTLEAFADTLIPGEKRFPADRAIAGAASGPGAVQAGAVDLMNFPATGASAATPAIAVGLNARATAYALQNLVVLDPTVPALVSLSFEHRTALLVQILDGTDPDQVAYFAFAALAFLAYHTAGHLHLADAVRSGHPGMVALDFPQPDSDDLWRFPEFSYGRTLAKRHPRTSRRGNPA